MTKIYEQHDAAFKNVQAHVILRDGEMVAKIAFKFPRDGAGRLYAYVHWLGDEMVRGFANGYGYDKRSAAVEDAVEKITGLMYDDSTPPQPTNPKSEFCFALKSIGGKYWHDALREAGFAVLQAV